MIKTTAAKPFVFTLMPFHDSFNDVWKLGIKDTCEKAGAYCERVDEQIHNERILDRIYNQINKADIIVADMTGKNPNVFYEVGYAHALGKTVLLIVKEEVDIPFDLRHHPFIIYKNSITKLQKALRTKVKFFLSNPDAKVIADTNELHFFVDGEQITEGSILKLQQTSSQFSYGFLFYLDILNASSIIYDDMQIGLLTDRSFQSNKSNSDNTEIVQRDKKILYLLDKKIENLYPSGYQKVTFFPCSDNYRDGFAIDDKFDFTLRSFSKLGTTDINFIIQNTRAPFSLGW